MQSLQDAVREVAERTGFSGAVRVDVRGESEVFAAYGLADRSHGVPNTAETLFGTASCTKTLTATTVLSLVEAGALDLDTKARSLLGDDLPLIADDVTVEHLLAHRSGIGDYFDEQAVAGVAAYLLPVPVHRLTTTEDYLPLLDGHPTTFPAGERFAYNNGGYVVLALLAERASGTPFGELVRSRVCEPAGMVDTAFLRSDELPGRAARGYLHAEGLRTNVLHLPVVGSGDGGIYSTVADLAAFWDALLAGRIVSPELVTELLRPRSGYDAGVSSLSLHDPASDTTYTVLSNWSDGAWPIVKLLNQRLGL
jgi:CubicO group peptidase (beta-lactamase class C family)